MSARHRLLSVDHAQGGYIGVQHGIQLLAESPGSRQRISVRHGIEAVVVREEEVQGAFFSFQEFIWEMKDGGDGGGLAESDTPIANACVAALPMYG